MAGWLGRYGAERLTLALDTRRRDGRWTLPSAGWTETEARTLDELAPWYAAHELAPPAAGTDVELCDWRAGNRFNLKLHRHPRRHRYRALSVQRASSHWIRLALEWTIRTSVPRASSFGARGR
ncbi:hypothetical protein RLIN73S_02541 [Rhodanobacter lindaniclasticus]